MTQSMLEFVTKEEEAINADSDSSKFQYSNFSGALAMALCCIQPASHEWVNWFLFKSCFLAAGFEICRH